MPVPWVSLLFIDYQNVFNQTGSSIKAIAFLVPISPITCHPKCNSKIYLMYLSIVIYLYCSYGNSNVLCYGDTCGAVLQGRSSISSCDSCRWCYLLPSNSTRQLLNDSVIKPLNYTTYKSVTF